MPDEAPVTSVTDCGFFDVRLIGKGV
jgi:hypothetical protein